MAGTRGVVLLTVFLVSTTLAGTPSGTLNSRFDVSQHLFEHSGPHQRDLPIDRRFEAHPSRSGMQDMGREKKKVGLAAIFSLLLPGMGELYAGNFDTGRYFLIGESALWLTFTAFEVYGNSLRSDARAYAAARAGIDPAGKDDQFYVDIGNFLSIDEYNQYQLQNRQQEKLYYPNTGHDWRWESDQARATYRSQRVSSENMFNNEKFVVIAVLVNHVASAINAARAVVTHNREIEEQVGHLDVKADVMGGIGHPHGILLTVTKTF